MRHKGYTLVELVITVSLLVIILAGGTAIFLRSLRSSGLSDSQSTLNESLNSLDLMMEKVLRYGTVTRLVDSDGNSIYREKCIEASSSGVTGVILAARDSEGGTAIYSLSDGVVSSSSGVAISNPNVYVTSMQFTWYCISGINDKINLLVEATVSGKTGAGTSGTLDKDINLLNSGIN
jgi:prepilin-type N-terminal cleavage/methylation domain-containing protein